MKSRIIIVHGWADNPQLGWMNWLAQQLEAASHEVMAPQFPETPLHQVDLPAILTQLHETIGELRQDDIFVGHSMGVSLILRTLLGFPEAARVRGLVLVAGLASSSRYRPNVLFDPPLDFARIIRMTERRIVIHSDDDPLVPPTQSQELGSLLQAEVRIDLGKGHFVGLRGLSELPSVLTAVQDCLPK